MSLPLGGSRNAACDPTLTATLPSWCTSTVPTASSSDSTACHSTLWLAGWAKIWRTVSRWRLSRCCDSGEDVIRAPFWPDPTPCARRRSGRSPFRPARPGHHAGHLGPPPRGLRRPGGHRRQHAPYVRRCWATIVTGTGVAGHRITGNDLTGHRLADHPDFVTVATRAGLPTLLAVSGWPPLALPQDGGPMFAEASRREFVAVAENSMAAWYEADESITELAAGILVTDGPRLSFVPRGRQHGRASGRRGRRLPCRGAGRRPARGDAACRGQVAPFV